MLIFKSLTLILGMILTFNSVAMDIKSESIYMGEKLQIHSKILDEQRSLLIKLPTDYEIDTLRRYPVLFTLDGDTHFGHVTGTVDWLSNSANRIPKMIVVAVSNTNRGRDMSPSYNNGGSDDFIAFLEKELVPFINQRYRTEPFRILLGHSMAGHLALNAYLQKPELFNAYVVTSPYFTMDRGEVKLTEQLAGNLQNDRPGHHFFYASIGDEKYLLPRFQKFINGLQASKDQSLDWHSVVFDDEEHMSTPARTLNPALQFIFAKQRVMPTSELAKQGPEAIREHFKTISSEVYGYDVSPVNSLNRLGYHLVYFEKDLPQAIEVFETNANWHPKSAAALDALAFAYSRNKEYEKALKVSNKAVSLVSPQSYDFSYYQSRNQRIVRAMQAAK